MNEELLKRIEAIRARNWADDNEAAVKQGIILPVLHELGWDPFNVEQVKPEYSVGGGNVDYCLQADKTHRAFVEVKRPSIPLDGAPEEQLLKYAFSQGVKLAVLTNGISWWFYLPLEEGGWEQRKCRVVDLFSQAPDVVASYLEDLLGFNAIKTGSAVELGRKLLQTSQRDKAIEDAFPKAWQQLLSGPDARLLDLLAETVEKICGYKPDAKDVAEFLPPFVNPTPHYPEHIPPRRPSPGRRRIPVRPGTIGKAVVDLMIQKGVDNVTYAECEAIARQIKPDTKWDITHWYYYRNIARKMVATAGLTSPVSQSSGAQALPASGAKRRPRRGPSEGRAERPGSHARNDTNTKPAAFTLFGSRVAVRTWQELLLGVCEALAVRHGGSMNRLDGVGGHRRPWFSVSKRRLVKGERIPGSRLFVDVHLSARQTVSVCRRALRELGHDPNELRIGLR